jgi:hypothetical protein
VTRRGRFFLACLSVLASALAGCAGPGDFGRPKPGIWTDSIAPAKGFAAATGRGEAASPFHFTDDEEQMRNRAWRFVMPAHERSTFDKEVAELAYFRILPAQAQSRDVAEYFRALTSGGFRSQVSRYNRLVEDADADRVLIAPFRLVAQRVVAADRVRLRTVDGSPYVPASQRDPAYERVLENEGLVLWVCERITFRLESYRFALANLVVEMPSREAIRAERAIMALEAEAALLCRIETIGVVRLPDGRPRPVVYKG